MASHDSCEGSGDSGAADTRGRDACSRRGYLGLLGAGVTAGLLGRTAAGRAAAVETVTLSSGETWYYSLSPGETFENVHIDCTAANTQVSLRARTSDWTIRNVGIEGVHDKSGGHAVIIPEAPAGETCVIENLYMGDGSSEYDGAGESETAVWVPPEHSGTLVFRDCNFQDWKDNAIYASAPGKGGNGPVIIENCYASNNNHADYRVGSTGSVVRDSVVDGAGDRGVWCWFQDGIEIRNCDIRTNDDAWAAIHAGPSSPGHVDVYDTQYQGALVEEGRGSGSIDLISGNGTNPDTSMPAGVPTSAAEAAAGEGGGGDTGGGGSTDPGLANRLVLTNESDADQVTYELAVSGELRDGGDLNDHDTISGSTATGELWGGQDSYAYDGHVTAFSASDAVRVVRNGTAVPTDRLVTHELTITGTGPEVTYTVDVTGSLEATDAVESHDTVGDRTASGRVSDTYADRYRFTGAIARFEASGALDITLDGEAVNGAALGSGFDEVALITDPDASGFEYELEVRGDARRAALGQTPSGNEIHDGKAAESVEETAEGWLFTGTLGDGFGHGFLLEGEIVRFEASDWETGDDPVGDYWIERAGECVLACGDDGPSAVGDSTNRPTDPDGDGAYEDVDGDDDTDYNDVITLFENRGSGAVADNPAAFDFDGDGGLDSRDIIALLDDV